MATNKYFKCPYCDKRLTRTDMVNHISNNHTDVLPEGFTPLRMTFHVVNKKDVKYRRPCRICKADTDWDEKKGRYDFLCGKKSCHDAWVEQMVKTMGDEMGKHRPTATDEGLEKMLASRSISGKYKWSDGTEKTYTGSYEKTALEFFDKVLECKSEDVVTPGPILKYQMDGKEHTYISDILYVPYNLIIEVKDGGKNPNTNPNYTETRKRQMAKEEYVIKHTNYNYLRLTDKDFSQILAIFSDLKLRLIDNDSSRVIHVNENMPAMGSAPVIGMGDNDLVIVNHIYNTAFAGGGSDFSVADSPLFNTVFTRNSDGNLIKTDKTHFMNCNYTPYIIRDKKKEIFEAMNNNLGQFVDEGFIFESVFGHKLYSSDQIVFEKMAEPYNDFYADISSLQEQLINELKGE